MVFINGVKYACERCIRGHRVTTCTHTDQPLTMIKPKGRPATQCQHCREQRKHKNSHVQCSCGRKGKPPGMHLALCWCHKSSHCTCSNKKNTDSKKKTIEKALTSVGASVVIPKQNFSTPESSHKADDVGLSSDENNGLLSSLSAASGSATNLGAGSGSEFSQLDPSGLVASVTSLDEFNLAENMFPLFPLIGSSSFDKGEDQPLTSIPDDLKSKVEQHVERSSSVSNDYPNVSDSGTSNDVPTNVPAGSTHYHPIRPKRPESSLSLASNSSAGSRLALNSDALASRNRSTSSAAFPPQFSVLDEHASDEKDEDSPDAVAKDFWQHPDNKPLASKTAVNSIDPFENSISMSDNELRNFLYSNLVNFDFDVSTILGEGISPAKYEFTNDL